MTKPDVTVTGETDPDRAYRKACALHQSAAVKIDRRREAHDARKAKRRK